MEKVKLTKVQANAIRIAVADYGSDNVMNDHSSFNWGNALEPLNVLTPHQLARALYVGYEVEPEFKVGDWATTTGLKCDGTYKGITSIVTNTNALIEAPIGLDFDKENQVFSLDEVRLATSKEIAKEKERRWWAKHGRDVWEVQEDDILEYLGDLYIIDCFDSEKICLKSGIERKTNYAEPFDFVENHFKIVCFAKDRKDVKE